MDKWQSSRHVFTRSTGTVNFSYPSSLTSS